MQDLLLVRPGDKKRIYGSLSHSLAAIEPPMWAGLMAAFAREKGYGVGILDADAEGLSAEQVGDRVAEIDPGLLGVVVSGTNPSASTMNMPGARAILEAVGQAAPRVKTFLAGLHPSALPERTLREEPVDFVIQGETFATLGPLLDAVKAGRTDLPAGQAGGALDIPGLWYRRDGDVASNPRPKPIPDLDALPTIAWDLLPMDRYRAHNWHCFAHPDRRRPYAILYTSLGCPFQCSFCCINAIFGSPGIRYRSPRRVLEEIDLLVNTYGVRNFKVMDEMFVMKEDHVGAICDGIIDRGYDLNIWAYARIDTINEKMLAKLKAAGFDWLAYGIEAGDESVRKGVAKGRFGRRQILDAIRLTRDAGIAIGGNYIFGLPDDTPATMRKTFDLAVELNCEYANFYSTMAYPGSKLHEQALAEGTPLPESWEAYAQYSEETFPLPTKHLSPGEVLRFRDWAFHEYHSSPRYQDMLAERFGPAAVRHVQDMLRHKLHRKHR